MFAANRGRGSVANDPVVLHTKHSTMTDRPGSHLISDASAGVFGKNQSAKRIVFRPFWRELGSRIVIGQTRKPDDCMLPSIAVEVPC